MATFIDIGLFEAFDIVFPVILVFAITFAILYKSKILGEGSVISAIVAVVAAFMVLLFPEIVEMINIMVPWFAILFIFIILMMLMFQLFGASEQSIFGYLQKDRLVGWAIVGVSLVIIGGSFVAVFGQTFADGGTPGNSTTVNSDGSVATGDFGDDILNTVFHPKVLGFMALLLIMMFAVALLTGRFPNG